MNKMQKDCTMADSREDLSRKKRRGSWFDRPSIESSDIFTTKLQKPEMSPLDDNDDDDNTLFLSHFTKPPHVSFGKLKVGRALLRQLVVKNPHDTEQRVIVEKVPIHKKFSVDKTSFTVGADSSVTLEIIWAPEESGSCREMIRFHVDCAYRLQVYVHGIAEAVQPKKKAAHGFMASSLYKKPLTELHTPNLASIRRTYSSHQTKARKGKQCSTILQSATGRENKIPNFKMVNKAPTSHPKAAEDSPSTEKLGCLQRKSCMCTSCCINTSSSLSSTPINSENCKLEKMNVFSPILTVRDVAGLNAIDHKEEMYEAMSSSICCSSPAVGGNYVKQESYQINWSLSPETFCRSAECYHVTDGSLAAARMPQMENPEFLSPRTFLRENERLSNLFGMTAGQEVNANNNQLCQESSSTGTNRCKVADQVKDANAENSIFISVGERIVTNSTISLTSSTATDPQGSVRYFNTENHDQSPRRVTFVVEKQRAAGQKSPNCNLRSPATSRERLFLKNQYSYTSEESVYMTMDQHRKGMAAWKDPAKVSPSTLHTINESSHSLKNLLGLPSELLTSPESDMSRRKTVTLIKSTVTSVSPSQYESSLSGAKFTTSLAGTAPLSSNRLSDISDKSIDSLEGKISSNGDAEMSSDSLESELKSSYGSENVICQVNLESKEMTTSSGQVQYDFTSTPPNLSIQPDPENGRRSTHVILQPKVLSESLRQKRLFTSDDQMSGKELESVSLNAKQRRQIEVEKADIQLKHRASSQSGFQKYVSRERSISSTFQSTENSKKIKLDFSRKSMNKHSPPKSKARNTGTAKKFFQSTKPKVAQRKLNLVKSTKTAPPKHPMPFASKNIYYDERWMQKQEWSFSHWLNFILTPLEEYKVQKCVKVDAGKLYFEKQTIQLAPTKEILSYKAYMAMRRLNRLRRSACQLFQSDQIVNVVRKVEAEVESGRLVVRNDRPLHADVGLKQKILDLILSYNPLWLRIGLETTFGELLLIQSNTDVVGLSTYILTRLLCNPDIATTFAHPSVPHLYRDGYQMVLSMHTLKKFLILVYFLDNAKTSRLIEHDPCLFCKDAEIKTSKDMLLAFSRDYLSGEGDITRHLGYLGYRVYHSQTLLDEYNYAVTNLAVDLRDGVRLTRVVELLTGNWQMTKSLRVPAISLTQKVHNIGVALKVLSEKIKLDTPKGSCITAKDIVDGHREKTLILLWKIVLNFQVGILLDIKELKHEIDLLNCSLKVKFELQKARGLPLTSDWLAYRRDSSEQYLHLDDEKLKLLFRWCQAVCAHYGLKIENFTVSFSDGRVLCHLLHHYHPGLLPLDLIHQQTSQSYISDFQKYQQDSDDSVECSFAEKCSPATGKPVIYAELLMNEVENFKLLTEKVSEIGGIPLMLKHSDMTNTIPDEKVVITYVAYLCIRLLEIRQESRAACIIQLAWRKYLLRKTRHRNEVVTRAAVVMQRAVRRHFAYVRLQQQWLAAVKIQALWRGYQTRKNAIFIREQWEYKQHSAATIIQAFWRAFYHRCEYQQLKDSTLVLQSHIRGYLVRQEMELRRKAAERIQQWYHNCKARYEARNELYLKKLSLLILKHHLRLQLHEKIRAAEKIQAVWKGHRQYVMYRNMKAGVILIQKNWLMYRKRKYKISFQQKTEDIAACKIQAWVKRFLVRKHYRRLRSAVIVIQHCMRNFLLIKREKEAAVKSAMVIKAFLLGQLARRRFLLLRSVTVRLQQRFRAKLVSTADRRRYLQLRSAVITIQAAWRGHLAQHQYTALRQSVTRLQAYTRRYLAIHKYKLLRQAAVSIQSTFRGYLVRKRCQLVRSCIIKIQRCFRGYQHRNRYIRLRHATIVFQASWRRYVERKRFLDLNNKLVKIQSNVRTFLAKKHYIQIRQAAIIIQRSYRRKLAVRDLHQNLIVKCHAAIVVQSYFRMWFCQKRYALLKSASILLQSAVRAHQVRRRYMKQRWACVVIQSAVRGFLCRKVMYKQVSAAVIIQKMLRMHLSHSKFQRLREAASVIQQHYKARLLGRKILKDYQQLKSTCIWVQRNFKEKQRKTLERRILTSVCSAREHMSVCERKKTSSAVQSCLQTYIVWNDLTRVRAAAVTLQIYFRAKLAGRRCREDYLAQKRAVVIIQAAVRRYIIYKQIKKAAAAVVVIQAWFRSYRMRRIYIKTRRSICIIQSWYRGMVKQKQAAIIIQMAVRSFLARKNYLKLQQAAITCQRKYRVKLAVGTANLYLDELHMAARVIQVHYKMYLGRKKFRQCQVGATKIQPCREEWLHSRQRWVMMMLQNFARDYLIRKNVTRQHEAAITIQKFYRQYKAKIWLDEVDAEKLEAVRVLQYFVRVWLHKRHDAAIKIQVAVRIWLSKIRTQRLNVAATIIQTCVKRWLARSYYKKIMVLLQLQKDLCMQQQAAAIKIQAAVRGWIIRNRISTWNVAATYIQSMWKGYKTRSKINSRKLVTLRHNLICATKRATDNKTLGNRLKMSLYCLHHTKYGQVSEILWALMNLETATRLSPKCCLQFVADDDAVVMIYWIIRRCNRSQPHMEMIKYSVQILLNLAKYDQTISAVYSCKDYFSVIVNLMQIYRDKGHVIFTKACLLLGIIALDMESKGTLELIQHNTVLMARIRSIYNLMVERYKREEARLRARAKLAAVEDKSVIFTFATNQQKKIICPEWFLGKMKMPELEEPVQAINYVMNCLVLNVKKKPKD